MILAGWALLFLAGAGGVGLDVGELAVPLLLPPVAVALFVFIGGRSRVVLLASILASLTYAALGVWNFLRAAEVERQNPGTYEVSGGVTSVGVVVIALAIALWSAAAVAIQRRLP